MRARDLRLCSDDLRDTLLPLLLGRVFHVTCLAVADSIMTAGEIQPNRKATRSSPFGSTNAFFRNRGCVSLFDYRTASPQQIEDSLGKCSPYHVSACSNALAFFFLSNDALTALVPWTRWKEEGVSSEKIVPYVEAGHPGPILLTSIDELLRVAIQPKPDPIVDALQRGRVGAARKSRAG